MPGCLIVMTKDTVESLSQMNSAALVSLRPTLAMITAAVETVVQLRASLLRFILRADMRCSLSPFCRTESLTAKYFAAHPHETEISVRRLMNWARRTLQKPIGGMDGVKRSKRLESGSRRVQSGCNNA
jgi:hypothetical protein